MANFYRLTVFWLGVFCAPAYAAFPATVTPGSGSCFTAPCYLYSVQDAPGSFDSPPAACTAAGAFFRSEPEPYRTMVATVDGSICRMRETRNSTGEVRIIDKAILQGGQRTPDPVTYSCPSNATLSGTSCACNTGFIEDGASCKSQQAVDNEGCKTLVDGLNYLKDALIHYGSASLTACYGGYVLRGTGAAGGTLNGTINQSELYGPFSCSGENATSCTSTPKPSPITATCAPGTFPGTVNGLQVCVPGTTSVEAPKTETATPPTPGASAPAIPGAPPGTTEKTTQTTCSGDSCTTTTGYKDGAGASTGTGSKTESKSSYCADNPKAPGCAEVSGSFAGSCGAFVCKGDALQCAIAGEQHKRNCQFYDAPTDQSVVFAANDNKQGKQYEENAPVDMGSSRFSTANALGVAASCVADKSISINVSGRSFTAVLPFSMLCPWLSWLGYLNLAVSFVLAARIVGRG